MEQDIRELELEAPTQVELSLYKTEGDWALERWPLSDPAAPPETVELTQEDDPTARQCTPSRAGCTISPSPRRREDFWSTYFKPEVKSRGCVSSGSPVFAAQGGLTAPNPVSPAGSGPAPQRGAPRTVRSDNGDRFTAGRYGDYRPLWPPERAVKSEEGNSPSHGAAMTAPSGRGPASPLWGGGPAPPGRKGFPWGLIKLEEAQVCGGKMGVSQTPKRFFGELAERREDNSCAAKEKFSGSFC